MATLPKRIQRIYKSASKPFDALWRWAKRPDKPGLKSRRFGALKAWAQRHVEAAREAGDEVSAWVERRNVYRRKQKFFKQKAEPAPVPSTGVVIPERPWNPNRRPVAAWMVPWIDKSWDAGWRGILNSGWRSPEYSEQLCYQICGAPTCPGRCAGKTSNHTKHVEPEGAIDVSDPDDFAAVQGRIGSGLWNALGAADPWHFSRSGR